MSDLKAVETKILKGLEERRMLSPLAKLLMPKRWQKAWAQRPAPKGPLGLGVFLGTVLNKEDYEVLELLEQNKGEEAANQWLGDLLASSGDYDKFGDEVAAVL